MAYNSGMLNQSVIVRNRKHTVDGEILDAVGEFGVNSGGVAYDVAGCIWANVTWSKGVKSIREGALDAYDTIMVRCRWTPLLSRESRLAIDGTTYIIQSFHADKRENTIQITAIEMTI